MDVTFIIIRAPNFDPKFGYPTRPDPKFRVRLDQLPDLTRSDPNLTQNENVNNSVNISPFEMKQLPLDSSRQYESNGSNFINIQSVVIEIMSKNNFFTLHKI